MTSHSPLESPENSLQTPSLTVGNSSNQQSMKGCLKEIAALEIALDKCRKNMADLKERKKQLSYEVQSFLEKTGKAIRYKDTQTDQYLLVSLRERNVRGAKPIKQKVSSIKELLDSYGIKDSEKLAEDILDVTKKPSKIISTVNIKKEKNAPKSPDNINL